MALRKQIREAIRGDAHRHIQCVKKNAKEDHRSGRRTVFVRGRLGAKVEQQPGGGGFGGNFCAPEIVNVVSAVKAERAEHVRDRGGGALAHHSGRAEAEGGRDVEVEAETEVVVVAGIDAKLSVGAAEVFLEEVTPGAFIADNGLKGIGTREAKGKWLVEVGVFWYAVVDGQERWVTEVNDNPRFPGSAAGDLKRRQNKRKLQRIDFEQSACSPQRTLLFKKRVGDVGLSQGRTVIFVGGLGRSRFHVPDRPTKLQKIAEFLIVIPGEALSPLRNVQIRGHGKAKREGVGTDGLLEQGVELNDGADEVGLGWERPGSGMVVRGDDRRVRRCGN